MGVKTQMSRQKGDDNKLREKHTSTVSCDWSPNSGHIHWRSPHAVVQELYKYIRRFKLEWNYLKHWNKFRKSSPWEVLEGQKRNRCFFHRTQSGKVFSCFDGVIVWTFSFWSFFLRWRLPSFLSSRVHQWNLGKKTRTYVSYSKTRSVNDGFLDSLFCRPVFERHAVDNTNKWTKPGVPKMSHANFSSSRKDHY